MNNTEYIRITDVGSYADLLTSFEEFSNYFGLENRERNIFKVVDAEKFDSNRIKHNLQYVKAINAIDIKFCRNYDKIKRNPELFGLDLLHLIFGRFVVTDQNLFDHAVVEENIEYSHVLC